MTTSLFIVGAGGHGQAVAELVKIISPFESICFIDDKVLPGSFCFGLPAVGPISRLPEFASTKSKAVVAIGNNKIRRNIQTWLLQLELEVVTLIHPRATVSPSAKIGCGSVVMANAVVGTLAELGAGVIVNAGAVVDHHAYAGDYSHLGVGALMAGGTKIDRNVWMQAGSAIGYGVCLPEGEVLVPGESRS